MELIEYRLSGEIVNRKSVNFAQLESYPVGQRVRITLDDGDSYTGFWNTVPKDHSVNTIEVSQYDLDESTATLRSYNDDTLFFVPTKRIAKVEAILYSSPRWGAHPTNQF